MSKSSDSGAAVWTAIIFGMIAAVLIGIGLNFIWPPLVWLWAGGFFFWVAMKLAK